MKSTRFQTGDRCGYGLTLAGGQSYLPRRRGNNPRARRRAKVSLASMERAGASPARGALPEGEVLCRRVQGLTVGKKLEPLEKLAYYASLSKAHEVAERTRAASSPPAAKTP